MAKVISTVTDAMTHLNSLYEFDSTVPTSGDEDYTVWLSLLNVAGNLWETEEGVLWNELFVKLKDAATGDKTTDTTNSYTCPTDFIFPASGFVWLGDGTTKKAYQVIDIKELTLHDGDQGDWCYFIKGASPTLEFNPNIVIPNAYTINYNYYKQATKLTAGGDVIEMADPMFAVYYALGELKKEEGDTSALQIASQKLEAMKTKNIMPAWYQPGNELSNNTDEGLG
jgi:hypothetical protein